MLRSIKVGLGIGVLLVGCSFGSEGVGGGSANSLGDAGDGRDGDTSDATDGSGGSGTEESADTVVTGVPVECNGGGVCLPAPPEGWSGPVAIGSGPAGAALACPSAWPLMVAAHRDLTANGATCECDCTPPPGQCQVTYQYFASNACVIPVIGAGGNAGSSCIAHGSLDNSVHVRVTLNPPGECTPQPVENIPTAAWGEDVVVCTAMGGDACDDGSCYQTPPEGLNAKLCIARQGEHDCPGGVYSQIERVYEAVNDTRGCMPCGCTLNGDTSCSDGGLAEYSSLTCGDSPTVINPGDCRSSSVDGNTWAVRYSGTQPTVSCSPSTPQASGAATAAGATTLCCTP